jgi:thioredoxin reductase
MSEPCPLAPIHVIGGGLAGSEAAWQIARHNVRAVLHEKCSSLYLILMTAPFWSWPVCC